MSKRRKIFLGLLVIPIANIVASIISPLDYGPDTVNELVFLGIGIPISLLNAWEWFMPEISNKLFGKGT